MKQNLKRIKYFEKLTLKHQGNGFSRKLNQVHEV